MNTQTIIATAEKHAQVNDSAALCLRDAKWLVAFGEEGSAQRRALDSLRHSVGVFHADYRAVVEVVGEIWEGD